MRPTTVETNPTGRFTITEVDNAGNPQYFGYEDEHGNWYIAQNTSGAWRYIKGTSDFSSSWTNRSGLTYDYPSIIW